MEALEDCNVALKLDPNNEKALFSRAKAKIALNENSNDYISILKDLKCLVTEYPNNKVAKKMFEDVKVSYDKVPSFLPSYLIVFKSVWVGTHALHIDRAN